MHNAEVIPSIMQEWPLFALIDFGGEYFFKHIINPLREIPPYLGKATADATVAQATQSYKWMLGLFVFP